jgi:hypothetical protein
MNSHVLAKVHVWMLDQRMFLVMRTYDFYYSIDVEYVHIIETFNITNVASMIKRYIWYGKYAKLSGESEIVYLELFGLVWFIALNATFNIISVISLRSIVLGDETVVPGENHRPVASHWQTLSHNV